MKKQFLKIAGVNSEAAFYKKYPTEEAFFAAHPEARKMAMGGMPEAFPQIATFDKAFSYGVPPGPQYLEHGGSAFPQAQTEAQFFIPIYTDVYNPYNKAMGGSNVEMYPNAKTTPHWGPSNVWFQEGGQEGMPQQEQSQELDRLGVQNRTGAFANTLKQTANKANAKNAMMGAMNNVGMAKYGKELSKYAPGGYTINPNQRIASNVTQQMSPTSSQFMSDTPTYDQQLQANNMAYLNSMGYNPNMLAAMQQQMYGYNPNAAGNMNNFLPSLYDWNNPNQFMYRETGSPNWKFKTDIAGMGKRKGVSNIGLGEAWGLYSGDPAAREEALKKLNPSRITETPVGLFKRRMRRDYYWDGTPQSNSTFKDWGTGTAGQQAAQSSNAPMDLTRQNQPGPVATQSNNPIPFTLQDANAQLQQNDPRARAIMNNLQNQLTPNPYANTSNYGPLASGFVDPTSSAGPQSPMQSDVNAPLLAPGQQGYDPTVRSTITSQPPSNTNSSDPNVAVKKAGPTVNQAYIDAQQGVPYNTVGPMAVGPNGDYDYLNETPAKKYGGSYKQGDVVYMSDDEIAEFIRNGGQIEEME